MKRLSTLFLSLLPLAAGAATFDQAASSIDQDLQEAVSELAAVREQIKEEKIPLAREMAALEESVREKRREAERIQRLRDNRTIDLSNLENNVKSRRDEIDYLHNLVSQYVDAFGARINLAENALYREKLDEAGSISADPDMTKGDKLLATLDFISEGIARTKRLSGGDRFEGRAVAPSGELIPGEFTLVGPLAFFSADDGQAGLSVRTNSTEPTMAIINPEATAAIASFDGSGPLPLDSTLGDAFAIEETRETLWEHIQKGKIWIWPILTFAALALLVTIFKAFEVYTVKMPRPGTLHTILKLLDEGKKEEAEQYAKSIPGPAGKMLLDGVLHADESKELVEEVLYERMLELQPRLERLLPFLAVSAATAPLLGLLGTVTGMINTFKLITIFGTGDAAKLAGGISEALITTEFGLIVAIPSLVFHALLTRRASGVMANMERMAVAFVNGLPRKDGEEA